MSAEAIDSNMPAILTLGGSASMNEADTHGYRYELSPERVLSVTPPPGFAHARIVNRLTGWLLAAGWTLEQVYQALGLRIPGREGEGGRIPDLIVWARRPHRPSMYGCRSPALLWWWRSCPPVRDHLTRV